MRPTQPRGRLAEQVIHVEIMEPSSTMHFQGHHLDFALNVAKRNGQETVTLSGYGGKHWKNSPRPHTPGVKVTATRCLAIILGEAIPSPGPTLGARILYS